MFNYEWLRRQCCSCSRWVYWMLDYDVVEIANLECSCERTVWMSARKIITSMITE